VVAALAGAAVHGSRPAISYRSLELGASTFEIGLVQAAYSVVPAVLAVAVGRFIDRVGEQAWIAVAMAIFTVGAVIAAYSDSMLGLAIAQLVVGLGQILYLVASQSLIANFGPRNGREVRFGQYSTGNQVGQLLGPAMAAFVIGGGLGVLTGGAIGAAVGDPGGPGAGASGGGAPGSGAGAVVQAPGSGVLTLLPTSTASLAFVAIAVLTVLAALAALTLPRLRRSPRAGTEGQPQPGMVAMTRQVMRRRGMPAAMAVSIIVASSVDIVIAYLPVYGEAVGLSVGLVGLLLSVRGIAGLVARFFMSQLIGWLGRERLLAVSMALAAAGLLVVPFVTSEPILIGAMIAGGLGLGLGQPMTIAWVASRSSRQERATALGVRLTGNRGALLVIPPLMGAIAGAAGIAAIFVTLALALGAGTAIALRTPFDELAGNPDQRS
jgi:predicted MFS family arabinose efflux permease